MEFDRPGFDREVGLRLQLHRKRRGITQAVIAEKIGVPRASYANIEAGRQRVAVDILWRAAVVLNISIAALVPEPLHRASTTAAESPYMLANSVLAENSANYIAWGEALEGGTSVSFPYHGIFGSPKASPVEARQTDLRVVFSKSDENG